MARRLPATQLPASDRDAGELNRLLHDHLVLLRTFQVQLARAMQRLGDAALGDLTARDLAAALRMVGDQVSVLRRVLPVAAADAAPPAESPLPFDGLRLMKPTGTE